jgi:hypothetical protein
MPSMFVADLRAGRRQALKALGGMGLALASGAGWAAAPAVLGGERRLDLANPRDNLYAFGKIWAGYDEPVIGAFHGLMYARIPGKRLVPLFDYTGTGIMQAKVDSNGDLLIKSRETGYFADLRTGEVLEHWDNPFTGERCEVYHFYNDILGGRLTDEIPKFLAGGNNESPTLMNEGTAFPDENGRFPFLLPFRLFGDDLLLSWDYAHEYANPVTPEGWPSYSTGPTVTPSEHFVFNVSLDALADRSLPTVRMHAGFTRLSESWPFMRMGVAKQKEVRELVLFGRMHSHKGLKGYGDVPPKVLAYIEKHAPEYLTLPAGWPDTNARLETWKAFAMDVPPETPGYPWKWAGQERPVELVPPTGLGARSYGKG